MPVSNDMLLPARCCLVTDNGEETHLQRGDTVRFGLNRQKGVEGHPRFFRGNSELRPTSHHANGDTSSGPSNLLLLRPHEPDGPSEYNTQAMVYAEFIASLLGYRLERVEQSTHRIIFRFV